MGDTVEVNELVTVSEPVEVADPDCVGVAVLLSGGGGSGGDCGGGGSK